MATTPEEARAAWERIRAFDAECRATFAKLTIHHNYRNRHQTVTTASGPAELVKLYCGKILATDTCTPMYEHMLTKVGNVVDHGDGTLTATLTKSHYAGD